jgi:hypothetical protein
VMPSQSIGISLINALTLCFNNESRMNNVLENE